jgi:hypothetical protein
MIAERLSKGTRHVQFYRSRLMLQGQCQSPHSWIADDPKSHAPGAPNGRLVFLPTLCLILLESLNPFGVWFVLSL